MMQLQRKKIETINIQDLLYIKDDVNTLQEFDLISEKEVVALPKNLFIFISPLLRTRPNVYRCDRGKDSKDSADCFGFDDIYIPNWCR